MVSERLCKNNIKGGVRKSVIKSALLTDTLKFTMFSRHFGSCWDTQHFLLATKLLLLSRFDSE